MRRWDASFGFACRVTKSDSRDLGSGASWRKDLGRSRSVDRIGVLLGGDELDAFPSQDLGYRVGNPHDPSTSTQLTAASICAAPPRASPAWKSRAPSSPSTTTWAGIASRDSCLWEICISNEL